MEHRAARTPPPDPLPQGEGEECTTPGEPPMPLTAEQHAEIDAARAATAATRRPTVPALEDLLFRPLPVLDHGFVRVIDYMGDDSAIVQAARVSYGRGTKRVSEDAGLIRYLMRHRHSTPFEMCEIKYHVKLPIFVARQWIRHRTANVNEYSARYSILDREFYLPAPEHLAAQSAANRQGRGAVLDGTEAARVLDLLRTDAARTYDHYVEMLNEGGPDTPRDPGRQGLARELARMNLHPEHLYAVVLEDRPPQPAAFPVAAGRSARPVRDPRLCRGDAGHGAGLGARGLSGVPRLPAGRRHPVGGHARGGAADAGRGTGGAGGQRAVAAGMGGADGRDRGRRSRVIPAGDRPPRLPLPLREGVGGRGHAARGIVPCAPSPQPPPARGGGENLQVRPGGVPRPPSVVPGPRNGQADRAPCPASTP